MLAGGILNLRPAKNMSRKPEKQQEKHQRGRRGIFMNKTPKLFILAGAVLASLFLFVSIV